MNVSQFSTLDVHYPAQWSSNIRGKSHKTHLWEEKDFNNYHQQYVADLFMWALYNCFDYFLLLFIVSIEMLFHYY